MLRKFTIEEFNKELNKNTSISSSEIRGVVTKICENVREAGDEKLIEYTAKFDGVKLESLLVSAEEISFAYENVTKEWVESLQKAIKNIRSFHQKQVKTSWFETLPNGVIRGKLVRPIEKIGVYVPGGKAAYPSSALMGIIPALVAGASDISIVTPPDKSGLIACETLVAAHELGVKRIYKIGGAQAIAALAYGSETVKKVDKIVGPGNVYVTAAKKEVFGDVGIDMLAGPSEVCVFCDYTSKPLYVAADLLAQAEHDPLARVLLISKTEDLVGQILEELSKQIVRLPKRDIAKKSLSKGSYLVIESDDIAAKVINQFAPEHLELAIEKPFEFLHRINNAGSIFLGNYAAESLGDYFAGVNHILPTNGTSKFSSSLGVDDFVKYSEILYYSKEAMQEDGKEVVILAESEGLEAHANAIKVRCDG